MNGRNGEREKGGISPLCRVAVAPILPFSHSPVPSNAGLYLHIPYCRTKCHYCSFNSYSCSDSPPETYIDFLIVHCKKFYELWNEPGEISSVFIGGGTPTIYSAEHLARLLDSCRSIFTINNQVELTVETNPNTVSKAGFDQLRKTGVNRLSIGVQSFDDGLLSVLGRSHTAEQARQAVCMAKDVGFSNINIDLMYGLPGQSVEEFKKTLEQALALDVEHIAMYELTIEENTYFAHCLDTGTLTLPDEAEVVAMEEVVQTLLPVSGYERYEISNYAKAGFFCKHNINYWQNGAYFGVGAGAVSYFDGMRLKNIDNPAKYTSLVDSMAPYEYAECLSTEAAFRETVIMGLRLLQGVDLCSLKKRFGINLIEYYGGVLQKMLAGKLLNIEGGFMKLTSKSLPIANQVLSELV